MTENHGMGHCFGLSVGPQCNHRCLHEEEEGEGDLTTKGDEKMETRRRKVM